MLRTIRDAGSSTAMDEWAAQSAQLVLRACPSRGSQGFLEQSPAQAQLEEAAAAAAGGQASPSPPAWSAGESPQALRRQGYRVPRGRHKRGREEREQQAGNGGSAAPGPLFAMPVSSTAHGRQLSSPAPLLPLAGGYPSPRQIPGWGPVHSPNWPPPPPHYSQQSGWPPGRSQQQQPPPSWGCWPPPGLMGHMWG
jgi:hypothetical protein